jgi:hypothetical protein
LAVPAVGDADHVQEVGVIAVEHDDAYLWSGFGVA